MAPRTRVQHWSLPLGQAAFGLILLGLALLGSLLFRRSAPDLAAQLGALAPVSRAALLSGATPGEILIEGRVSRQNEVLAQSLVAYQRERAVRDMRNDIVWVWDALQNPPLLIDMADGPIAVAGSYALLGSLPTTIAGDYRYAGVGVGDQVVVVGQALPDNTETQLSASFILPGTRAEYARSSVALLPLGLGLGLVVAGATLMGWLLRQGYSPFPNRWTGR